MIIYTVIFEPLFAALERLRGVITLEVRQIVYVGKSIMCFMCSSIPQA